MRLRAHRPNVSVETRAAHKLVAEPGKATLRGKGAQSVNIWGCNGIAPGPDFRVRQGDDTASFGSIGERAHGGRFGNTFTCNGSTNHQFQVRAGERVRLRFCNVANASSFAVQIADHDANVIAVDGQPVEPFKAHDGMILLSPGQRVDAMVDMTGKRGSTSKTGLLGFDQEVSVGSLICAAKEVARNGMLAAAIELPANPLPTNLDLPNAVDVTLTMEGGAMGGMRGAKVDGWFCWGVTAQTYSSRFKYGTSKS